MPKSERSPRRLALHRQGRLPDTICPLPWVNVSIDVDGSSRPCCKFAHLTPDSPYQMASLVDHELKDVWNSEAMVKLRTDFRAGEQPADCRTCWDEESAGITSWRQSFLEDRSVNGKIDYDDLTPAAPKAIDLKLSNACNLKCRICGPVASSLWLQEEVRSSTGPFADELRANRSLYLSNKITHDEHNLETLRSWIPHLEHIEMTGGEPMVSPENREVIELIVAAGAAERISLVITTNATVIDERIMSALPLFRSVVVSLSVDDMGDRLTYERSPATWEDVVVNLDRYATTSTDTHQNYTNVTVSTLNIWYLADFLTWHIERYQPPAMKLHLNVVHNDRWFNIQNLPDPLKTSTRHRLEQFCEGDAVSPRVRGLVREVIDFMDDVPGKPDAWRELLDHIDARDAVRSERFADVFGEYVAEIDRLGLDDRAATTPPGGRSGLESLIRWRSRRSPSS